jgi:hypothetical protein
MNYSIIAYMGSKYGLPIVRAGIFTGGCYLSFGFGLLRGERRANAVGVKRDYQLCAHPH